MEEGLIFDRIVCEREFILFHAMRQHSHTHDIVVVNVNTVQYCLLSVREAWSAACVVCESRPESNGLDYPRKHKETTRTMRPRLDNGA